MATVMNIPGYSANPTKALILFNTPEPVNTQEYDGERTPWFCEIIPTNEPEQVFAELLRADNTPANYVFNCALAKYYKKSKPPHYGDSPYVNDTVEKLFSHSNHMSRFEAGSIAYPPSDALNELIRDGLFYPRYDTGNQLDFAPFLQEVTQFQSDPRVDILVKQARKDVVTNIVDDTILFNGQLCAVPYLGFEQIESTSVFPLTAMMVRTPPIVVDGIQEHPAKNLFGSIKLDNLLSFEMACTNDGRQRIVDHIGFTMMKSLDWLDRIGLDKMPFFDMFPDNSLLAHNPDYWDKGWQLIAYNCENFEQFRAVTDLIETGNGAPQAPLIDHLVASRVFNWDLTHEEFQPTGCDTWEVEIMQNGFEDAASEHNSHIPVDGETFSGLQDAPPAVPTHLIAQQVYQPVATDENTLPLRLRRQKTRLDTEMRMLTRQRAGIRSQHDSILNELASMDSGARQRLVATLALFTSTLEELDYAMSEVVVFQNDTNRQLRTLALTTFDEARFPSGQPAPTQAQLESLQSFIASVLSHPKIVRRGNNVTNFLHQKFDKLYALVSATGNALPPLNDLVNTISAPQPGSADAQVAFIIIDQVLLSYREDRYNPSGTPRALGNNLYWYVHFAMKLLSCELDTRPMEPAERQRLQEAGQPCTVVHVGNLENFVTKLVLKDAESNVLNVYIVGGTIVKFDYKGCDYDGGASGDSLFLFQRVAEEQLGDPLTGLHFTVVTAPNVDSVEHPQGLAREHGTVRNYLNHVTDRIHAHGQRLPRQMYMQLETDQHRVPEEFAEEFAVTTHEAEAEAEFRELDAMAEFQELQERVKTYYEAHRELFVTLAAERLQERAQMHYANPLGPNQEALRYFQTIEQDVISRLGAPFDGALPYNGNVQEAMRQQDRPAIRFLYKTRLVQEIGLMPAYFRTYPNQEASYDDARANDQDGVTQQYEEEARRWAKDRDNSYTPPEDFIVADDDGDDGDDGTLHQVPTAANMDDRLVVD
jgi:hypothetical protein